jgi:chromosome segregation ATPase
MEEKNNGLQKDIELLLSAKDFLKNENESVKRENRRLLENCERLQDIEKEAEGRFKEVSVIAKELETEKNRYKGKLEECGNLQKQVSSLQQSLKKAKKEKDILENKAKNLESEIANQDHLIKYPRPKSFTDTEENKVGHYIPLHCTLQYSTLFQLIGHCSTVRYFS